MENGLTEETGLKILAELQALNTTLNGELKREADERDKKLADDTKQAQLSAEALKQEQEQESKEEQERATLEQTRHDELVSGLSSISQELSADENSADSLETMKAVNENLKVLVAEIPNSQQNAVNSQFLGTAILTVLIVATAGLLLIKMGKWVGSKIINLI